MHVRCVAMPRKVRSNVYISPQQMAALKRISSKTRVPMAVLIRDGIDLIIAKYKKKGS